MDVTTTGDVATTTLWYSENGGTPTTIPGLTDLSPDQVLGPFPIGSSVHVELLHESDIVCDKNLGTFTHNTPCPPANDLCANATTLTVNLPAQCPAQSTAGRTIDAGIESALPGCNGIGTIQDVWYVFNTGYSQSPINIAIAAGSIGHYGVEIYAACGGTAISCTPNSPALVSAGGLSSFTDYRIRVFTNTSLGAAGTFTICVYANTQPSACGNTVYDPGGTGNYGNNQNVTTTYCSSTPGEVVTLTFSQFNLEDDFDFLYVHNGPTTASPVLGTFTGTTIPAGGDQHPRIRLPHAAVHLDGSQVRAGYTANVSCCATPLPNGNAYEQYPVCTGSTLQLNAGNNIGTLFSWTGPNGFTSLAQNPTIPNVTTAAQGTYTVTVRNGANGCPTVATTAVVVRLTRTRSPLHLLATICSWIFRRAGGIQRRHATDLHTSQRHHDQ
ncbi:MAG: hypothetical protein IPG92_07170 [Flavobacteriales bacterium]|nr:hypothetical protein [Flavobacteriales bacterium]